MKKTALYDMKTTCCLKTEEFKDMEDLCRAEETIFCDARPETLPGPPEQKYNPDEKDDFQGSVLKIS